jgi:hypothetical protein
MTDVVIKLKLFGAACIFIMPTVVVFITGDEAYLKTYLYLFTIPVIFYNEKGFVGFLKIWFEFHFLGKHKDGLVVGQYRVFMNRLKWLEEGNMASYEQRLIRDILEYNGATKVKKRYTGKHHNKTRYKINRKKSLNGESIAKYSNYKRKEKV